MRKNKAGLTILELIVITALVALLTMIVIVSLSNSRREGKDSSIKSQMISLRTAADLFSTGNRNSYSGFCSNDTNIRKLTVAIEKNATSALSCEVASGGNNFTAQVRLNSGAYYCVDSKGYSGLIDLPGTYVAGTQCK